MILPPARFFAQPPTQAELDFTNPILKNIEHVISGNAAFLTKGKYNTSLRTGTNIPALIRRPSGLSYALGTGATVNLLATDAGEWVNSQTEWTMFTLSFWRLTGAQNRAISTIAESPGASNRDRSLAVSATAGGYFQVGTRDGATDVIVSSTTTVTTIGVNPFTLAGRATKAELSIFVNGVKEGASAITSTGRTYTSPELVLGQGALGTGIGITQICNSDPTIFLVWSRALSDEEIASLHRNPWQVYRSANRIVFPEAAAVTAYSLDTTPGAYNLTGSNATVLFDRLTSVTPGAYSITGSDATVLFSRVVDVTPGAYDITGSNVTLEYAAALTLEVTPGAYSITGSSATVLFDRLTSVTPGAYSLTGSDVTLATGVVLEVTPGSYSITGSAVTTYFDRAVLPTPGAYNLTGSDVTFTYAQLTNYVLDTEVGSYSITGFSPRLTYVISGVYSQPDRNTRLEAIPTKAPNLTIPRPVYDVGQQMQLVNQLRLYFVGIDGATSSLVQITNTLSTLSWMDCN